MPRGQKKCPECRETCGPRCVLCPHCGHEFKKKTSPSSSSKPTSQKTITTKKVHSESDSKTYVSSDPSVRNISIPSGKPPVKPQGYVGSSPPTGSVEDHFPDGFNEETVKAWSLNVKEHGKNEGLNYKPSAIKYWARYFWNIRDIKTFQTVCHYIDNALGVKSSNLESATTSE